MKKFILLLFFIPVFTFAESMYSPTWGFFIDLPEGYNYVDGDARDRFSFSGPDGLQFDLVVYGSAYNTIQELAEDINRRISNRGDVDFFEYRGRQAAVFELVFGGNAGWGLAVELDIPASSNGSQRPKLLALAYGPSARRELDLFHVSALDSIAPSIEERRYPGPLIEYSYPRGEARLTPLAVSGLSALIHENDAEAAQVLVEREFSILEAYLNTPFLRSACIRYYRFIYRDSFDRISDAVSVIARNMGGAAVTTNNEKSAFAQRALSFVQGFNYERDLSGSDFINLVTAVTDGRGDCDSRSMLFALMLANVNIRSAIMLSHHYSHSMGLADVTGNGARYESMGVQYLVAETTARVNIGLIAEDLSDPRHWFAVFFE